MHAMPDSRKNTWVWVDSLLAVIKKGFFCDPFSTSTPVKLSWTRLHLEPDALENQRRFELPVQCAMEQCQIII